jgi:hypothetical protein
MEECMTSTKAILTAFALGLAFALATVAHVQAQEQSIATTVESLNGSGITGAIRLTEMGAGKLRVETQVTGAGAGPEPIHIHDGTCGDMNPEPKIPLTNVVGGTSVTELNVSLRDLVATPHAIYLHKSPEELPVFVACANITASGRVATTPSVGEADTWVESAPWMAGLGFAMAAAGYTLRRRVHRSASAVGKR